MTSIVICPEASLADVCREHAPSHVLGFTSPARLPPEPGDGARRLVFAFHDIEAPRLGLVPPDRDSIERMLAFARTWDGASPLVIHCFAGVSRSTAAAFALACQAAPSRSEAAVAAALREAAPTATPNRLMVALADDILGRGGRMIEAAGAIGRGADYVPFRSAILRVAAGA